MAFETVDYLSGVFAWIMIIIYVYVGLRIIIKYFEVKQRVFLLVGITWIGLSEPWWGAAVSFLIGLNDGVGLLGTGSGGVMYGVLYPGNPELWAIYFLLGNILIPITLNVWIFAFTDLLYKDKQKKICGIFIIYAAVYLVIFLILLFTNPALVGVLESPTDTKYGGLVMAFLLSLIVVIIVTGTLFARESIRSENPEIRLKGKLIRLAFILFCVSAALDSAITLTVITLPITRIILILSAIFFYGGFLLPNWMKKLFLKEGEKEPKE